MSESLLVGDTLQLDYSKTSDRGNAQGRYGTSVSSTTAPNQNTSVTNAIGSSQAFSALGVSPNDLKAKQP